MNAGRVPARDPEVERLWETEAARYDGVYDLTGRKGAVARARLEAALELVGPARGRALDLGMGGGRLCAALAERGWDTFGADASAAMVALARSRLDGGDERFVQAPVESLPFADGGFDAVTALGVLEYADDLEAALAELVRVLRAGGAAVVSFPNYRSVLALWRRHVVYPAARGAKRIVPLGRTRPPRATTPISPQRFLELLGAAGLAVESVAYLGTGGERRRPMLGTQLLVLCRRSSS